MRAAPIASESALGVTTADRLRHAIAGYASATWLLAVVVLVGLTLRVAWVLHVDPAPFGDTYWYTNVASNLVHGNGFAANPHSLWGAPGVPKPTAYYPPLYPFVLAALWKVIGFSLTSGKLLNACLDTLTIFFVYDIGRRVFDRRAGLAAAGVYALLPNTIAWLPLHLSEALFTLLFTAAVWLLVASRPQAEAPRPAVALLFGLLTGLALLTRGVGVVLPAAALIFWCGRDGWRPALQQLALTLAVAAAVLVPWTVRNWIVMDGPIVVSSNTGYNLRIGNSEGANGTFTFISDSVDGVPAWRALERPDWEARANRVLTRRALGYATTHPLRELELSKNKVFYLYRSDAEMAEALSAWGGPLEPRGLEHVLRPLVTATWFALLFATVASAAFWLRRTPERTVLLTVPLLWTVFHIVFFGLARYHLGLLPVMAVAAAGGATQAVSAVRSRLRRAVRG